MNRIGNSFKGVVGGFIFLVLGVILLWWNEGNNVRNLKTTAELEDSYVDVKSNKVESKNDGKLVATHGKLINEKELTDETFGVTIKTPIMKRTVEVYQWKETSNTDKDGNTTYSYNKDWSERLIDSSDFHETGHDNPTSKLYEDKTYTSDDVKVGAFSLSSEQVEMLNTKAKFTEFNQETINGLNLKITNNYITNSEDFENPKIGDVRITFTFNDSSEVSVLAVQSDESFVTFTSKAGKKVNKIVEGSHNGKDMIQSIRSEDKFMKWILRFFGFILCMAGFRTILKPISAITSYVPLLGSLVGTAMGLVSFVLSLSLSLFVIAIAWIRFRPIVGISLIAIVVALIIFLIIRSKKKKDQQVTNN